MSLRQLVPFQKKIDPYLTYIHNKWQIDKGSKYIEMKPYKVRRKHVGEVFFSLSVVKILLINEKSRGYKREGEFAW